MCKSHIALAVACVVAGIAIETLRTRKAPRAHNFSAGPGPLDNEVLAQAQSELWSLTILACPSWRCPIATPAAECKR